METGEQSRSYEAIISNLETTVVNGTNTPEIAAALAPFGYDAAAMAEGAALVATAKASQAATLTERAEAKAATAARDEAYLAVREPYTIDLAAARIIFKNDTEALLKMNLPDRRERPILKWIAQGRHFYASLLGNPAWLEAMAARNFSEANLQAHVALFDELEAAEKAQTVEMGESQSATKTRDTDLEAARDWVTDYRGFARIALGDQPQLLESLGVLVRS